MKPSRLIALLLVSSLALDSGTAQALSLPSVPSAKSSSFCFTMEALSLSAIASDQRGGNRPAAALNQSVVAFIPVKGRVLTWIGRFVAGVSLLAVLAPIGITWQKLSPVKKQTLILFLAKRLDVTLIAASMNDKGTSNKYSSWSLKSAS